jgi:hypothetical protein
LVDDKVRAQFVAMLDHQWKEFEEFRASLPKVRTTGFRLESQSERSNGQRQITYSKG